MLLRSFYILGVTSEQGDTSRSVLDNNVVCFNNLCLKEKVLEPSFGVLLRNKSSNQEPTVFLPN